MNEQKGFTLVEILTYIAVLAIIILAVSSFFLWMIRFSSQILARREVLDNSRRVVEIMTYEIREAKSIYTPTSALTQLSLETIHHLPEGEISAYIDFYLCENHICLKREGEDPLILTSNRVEVKSLEFSYVAITSDTPSVQIKLRID